MFISDKICFVELGKTGCSYIRKVLDQNIKLGKLTKIHDQISNDLLNSKKLKIGSIRNPLDWYISLWSFGCLMKKKDPLYSNLTSLRVNPKRLNNIKNNKIKKLVFLFDQFKKDISQNKDLYSDPYKIINFRNWIKLLFNDKKKNFISEQYSISNTNKFIGYMSFHYLIKFTNFNSHYKLYDGSLDNYDDVKKFYFKNSFIDYFILFEDMNNSLINLFNQIGSSLDKDELLNLKPVNKSYRLSSIDEYYDNETKEMVKYFDALIFELHNY